MANIESKNQGNFSKVYSEIEQSLSRSWSDWAITNKDVDNIHKSLESLNKQDYHHCLEQMGKNNLLNKYIDNMSSESRANFLNQATEKDYIHRESGSKPEGYKFDPPAAPDIYLNNVNLPKEIREAIHDYNIEKSNEYAKNYDAYIDRYVESVKNASGVETIKDLGSPHPPQNVDADRGVTVFHPDYKRFMLDRIDRELQPTDSRAYHAISDRVNDLSGVQRPGSFWLRVEGKVAAKADNLSFKAGGEIKISDYGRVDVTGKVGVETKVGPIKAGAEKTTDTGKTKLSIGVDAKNGKSVKVKTDGEFEATSKLAYAKVNPEKATFEGGVKLDKKGYIGDYGIAVEGKIGLGMKTITSNEVHKALTSPGFFNKEGQPSRISDRQGEGRSSETSDKQGERQPIGISDKQIEGQSRGSSDKQGEIASQSDTSSKATQKDVKQTEGKDVKEQTKQVPVETKSLATEKASKTEVPKQYEKQSDFSIAKGSVGTAERFDRVVKGVPTPTVSTIGHTTHLDGQSYDVQKSREVQGEVEISTKNIQTNVEDWRINYRDDVIHLTRAEVEQYKESMEKTTEKNFDGSREQNSEKLTESNLDHDKNTDVQKCDIKDRNDYFKPDAPDPNQKSDADKNEKSTDSKPDSSSSNDISSDELKELKASVKEAEDNSAGESLEEEQNKNNESASSERSIGNEGMADQGRSTGSGDAGGGVSVEVGAGGTQEQQGAESGATGGGGEGGGGG